MPESSCKITLKAHSCSHEDEHFILSILFIFFFFVNNLSTCTVWTQSIAQFCQFPASRPQQLAMSAPEK